MAETKEIGGSFEIVNCPFTLPDNQMVVCGYLSVPENRNQIETRPIKLMVAILKSSSKVEADPLVILAGGPGGKIVETIPEGLGFFNLFLDQRDVIVFDQRGVGLSKPGLECPEVNATLLDLAQIPFDKEQFDITLSNVVRGCWSDLIHSGVDLNSYNTSENAVDVEALRIALDYKQINLYGGSYGTRLALEIMRKYPDSARSAILDAPYPTQVNLFDDASNNLNSALEKLFDSCEASLGCNISYPHLQDVFYDTVTKLNQNPAEIEGVDPNSKENIMVEFDGLDLVDVLFNNLYVTEGLGYLPSLIYDIHDGEYENLKKLMWSPLSTGDPISLGMFFSTQCAEEAAFAKIGGSENPGVYPRVLADYITRNSLMGEAGLVLCKVWDVEAVPGAFKLPVSSDIPTLVLSGEFDPVISPRYAELIGETLKNSYVYVFPGTGHGSLSGGSCPVHLVTSFLSNPNVKPGDDCVSTMPDSPTFIIRSRAARPFVWPLIVALAGFLVYQIYQGKPLTLGKTWKSAWKASVIRVGWVPWMGTFVFTGLVIFWAQSTAYIDALPQFSVQRVVATIIPLTASCHLAFSLFQDEKTLELLLICPRPFSWIFWERFALIFLGYGLIAIAGIIAVNWIDNGGELLISQGIKILPPMLFLCGASAATTLTTRQAAFGLGLTVLLWFGMTMMADLMISRWPFLWPIHIYLQPDALSSPMEYTLNRVFIGLAGAGMLVIAGTRLLRSEENILLGKKP